MQGHNVKDCWQIHIVMGKDYKTGREIKKGTINYKGKIRCCTVNSGMIICRYEDNVFITGNSDCYAVMAEDICADTDRIYDMHNHDDELKRKNEAVKDLYDTLYTGETPTNEDILLGFVANQVLEELVFPGGFIAMYSLEKQMPGSSEMIAEINKDESLSHVPLFKNIFRTAIKETFNGVIPEYVMNEAYKMIKIMVTAEIRWTEYTCLNTLGFSKESIRVAIEAQANSICNNLGLDLLYEEVENNPLIELLKVHLKGGEYASRTAFFEENVVDYSKGALDLDY